MRFCGNCERLRVTFLQSVKVQRVIALAGA